jgi:hypothetical protein
LKLVLAEKKKKGFYVDTNYILYTNLEDPETPTYIVDSIPFNTIICSAIEVFVDYKVPLSTQQEVFMFGKVEVFLFGRKYFIIF